MMSAPERRIALDNAPFFGLPDAAAFLGVDPRSLRKEVAEGNIPHTKIGPRVLIPTRWLREQAQIG